jgi:hypothetical protein
VGPVGPTGARGPSGADGVPGAPGSAVAYGRVTSGGTFTTNENYNLGNNSNPATVRKPSATTGIYCIGSESFTPHHAVVSIDATAAAGGTAQSQVVTSGNPAGCTMTGENIEIKTFSSTGTAANEGFFIAIN